MIYTIGDKHNYEKAREGSIDSTIYKLGRKENYDGGFSFETYQQAQEYIKEIEMQHVWVVFGLEAELSDTEIHKCGKYRNLLKDSKIIFIE